MEEFSLVLSDIQTHYWHKQHSLKALIVLLCKGFFFFFNMATHLFNGIHTFVCVGSEVWVKLVQWVKNAIHLALNIIIPLLTFDSLLLMSVQEEMCSSIHETCPKEQVVFLTLAWYVNIVQVCISCPCYCHLWLT